MRRIAVALFAALMLGCGSDSTTAPETPKGTIVFKVDASSCSGTAAIDLFVDGTLVGTETLSSGTSSKAYTTTAGQHIVSASVANTRSRVWAPTAVTVPVNNSFTFLLLCA